MGKCALGCLWAWPWTFTAVEEFWSIVQLHPVIFAILNLAGALKGLGEQLAQVVVIRCILET
jgi:hypothetical protein